MRYIIFILFLFTIKVFAQTKTLSEIDQKRLDSIISLRAESKDKTTYSLEERFSKAERARRLSNDLGIDSTIIKSNKRIASIYREMKNYNLYKKINEETLRLSRKIKDSGSIAYVHFVTGNHFSRTLNNDSAYYHFYNAEKMYRAIKDNFNAGKVLINMAVIQKNEKDFIGSEITLINALELIEPLVEKEPKAINSVSGIYNNLAIVSKELEQYDRAIEYYDNALATLKKSSSFSKLKELKYFNNLGVVYENSGDYNKALELFKNILDEDDLVTEDAPFYARVLNNYARNKFLLNKDDKELPALYFKALAVRDSIGNKGGVMRSNIDIADYYLSHEILDKAKIHADKAYEISKKYDRFDDQLETLLLLAKIEQGDAALAHTQEYIALSDSLQKEERAIRNKFARIKYETDEIQAENIQISRERMWFLILAIGLGITAFLVYVIISQRSKNKELRFNQEQQRANEEIYNLMLSQQDKIEEGRTQEKKRISEDLHDGILGRLFGTRLSLDSLNMSSDADAVKNRGQYIDELKSIEQEIRRISHDLNTDFVSGSSYLDIVETLIENQTQAYQLSYIFNHKDEIDWETVSNKTKIHFYRMIQESLQNIYKHAKASHVDISFEVKDKQIYLSIADNGEGFVVNKAKKGIGLKNIRSRVEELKGELFINSQKNAGTSISISVPL